MKTYFSKKTFSDNSILTVGYDNKYFISKKGSIADRVFSIMINEGHTKNYNKAVKFLMAW